MVLLYLNLISLIQSRHVLTKRVRCPHSLEGDGRLDVSPGLEENANTLTCYSVTPETRPVWDLKLMQMWLMEIGVFL